MRLTLAGTTVATAALAITMQAAVADTTLRMWTFLDPNGPTGRERVLKKLIDSFEVAHPGVRIAVEKQVWSTMTTKLIAAHHAGNAPDIAWAHTELLGAAIEAGVLESLNDYFVGKWTAE